MAESRLTISKEMLEQLWQGYRCAACMEEVTQHGLGAFPEHCPAWWCNFPMREQQRARLEQDFVGEVERMKLDGWVEREEAFLEEHFHKPKPQIHVRRKP